MKASVEYLQKKFEYFNKLIFSSELPPIPIKLSNARSYVGQCCCKRRRTLLGKVQCYDFSIRVNGKMDFKETELEDVLIHEMIHYYIFFKGLKDSSSHGKIFRDIMDRVNSTFSRHISISHKLSSEQREQQKDNRIRPHIIAIISLKDGRNALKLLPRNTQSICFYNRELNRSGIVDSIVYYIGSDPWFNRFPTSSALNFIYIDKAEALSHLVGASELIVKRNSIFSSPSAVLEPQKRL